MSGCSAHDKPKRQDILRDGCAVWREMTKAPAQGGAGAFTIPGSGSACAWGPLPAPLPLALLATASMAGTLGAL